MSQLLDDLIAAKALIDTPYKYNLIGATGAIDKVAGTRTARNDACVNALRASKVDGHPTDWSDHASVMSRYDRAIGAAS